MSYEGTHLAVPAEQAEALRRLHSDGDDSALRARVRELLSQGTGQFSTDRYWETIRRCLAGELIDDPAHRPLSDAVLGGAALAAGRRQRPAVRGGADRARRRAFLAVE